MDRVGRRAQQITGERAAEVAAAAAARRESAVEEAGRRADERARQQRMQQILAMGDKERRRLFWPADRRILADVREMEWYSAAGARLDGWIDAFRKWATENDIATNVQVEMPRHYTGGYRPAPAPEPLTSGWLIFSDTHTWLEDVTPAWDRFPRSEERSSTTHYFIPREMQSQPSYHGTRDLANLRMNAVGPDGGGVYRAYSPQRAALPAAPSDNAIFSIEHKLTDGMGQWVADNPQAPWASTH